MGASQWSKAGPGAGAVTRLQPSEASGRSYGSTSKVAGFDEPKPKNRYISHVTLSQRSLLTCLFGAYLPGLVFIVVVMLFTYFGQVAQAAGWIAAVIGGFFLLVGAWPSMPPLEEGAGRNVYHWMPLASCVLALFLAVTVGRINRDVLEPWVHANYLYHYKDVLADADPLSVSDSGIIDFAIGTKVDIAASVSFRVWPNTYCAAPIVSNQTNTSRVGFWAVGVNCCENRGKFSCGSAEDPSSTSALRVVCNAVGEVTGHDSERHFAQAVRMSAAANGYTVAEHPILVSWLADPNAAAKESLLVATLVFVGLVLAAFVYIGCCQRVMTRAARYAS